MPRLTDSQIDQLWKDALTAEVRSLYFAELGSRYTKLKQIITGTSFFLSSGAVVTIIAHLPSWVPVLMSAVTALLTAYSIAVGLDRKAATMAKLHYSWSQIEADRRSLWNHWYDTDAEDKLRAIESRDNDISQTAVTEAPYDKDLIAKWQTFVNEQHNLSPA